VARSWLSWTVTGTLGVRTNTIDLRNEVLVNSRPWGTLQFQRTSATQIIQGSTFEFTCCTGTSAYNFEFSVAIGSSIRVWDRHFGEVVHLATLARATNRTPLRVLRTAMSAETVPCHSDEIPVAFILGSVTDVDLVTVLTRNLRVGTASLEGCCLAGISAFRDLVPSTIGSTNCFVNAWIFADRCHRRADWDVTSLFVFASACLSWVARDACGWCALGANRDDNVQVCREKR